MDQAERAKYKQLANNAIIDLFGRESREAQLAIALEQCVDDLEDYEAMSDKTQALEEENEVLSDTVKELRDSLQEVYRVSKSANSSDVKRLAEIQEICEEADVDLSKII